MVHGNKNNEPLLMGVDVARHGADNSVFAFRQGRDARTIASSGLLIPLFFNASLDSSNILP
jgi:hypothetical protein